MKRRTGFTLIELLVVIAIIAVLAAILFPIFSRVRQTAFQSNCQSNMKQIGLAVKSYLTDWDDTFPTNRVNNADGSAGLMNFQVQLSEPADPPKTFQFGVNWVEGLYKYIERAAELDESSSVWRCQAASNLQSPISGQPATASTAVVSYVFNGYLCEHPEGVVKVSANTMMVRETDRLVNAELRPFNNQMHRTGSAALRGVRPQLGTSADKPVDPFLNVSDIGMGTSDRASGGKPANPNKNRLHAKGSHILFADCHVKFFTTDLMPDNSVVQPNASWDSETEQWYNFNNSAANKHQRRSIGITP